MGSPFYRTAQPFTLAMFPSWGSSKGAGRKRLTHHKSTIFHDKCEENIVLVIFSTILERTDLIIKETLF